MSKPRAPRLSNEAVRKSIDADNQARRDRTNAKRRERAARVKADAQALKDAAEVAAEQRQARRDRDTEHAAALVTQREDFDVYKARPDCDPDLTFAAYLAENGFNLDGSPMPVDDEPVSRETNAQYVGPMVALKSAVKSYVKGANGNPHCNDPVAALFASVSRETTVQAIGALLLTKGIIMTSNPYSHLNPGQQSMNMRNKLRGAMKAGFVKLEDIALQLEALAATKA